MHEATISFDGCGFFVSIGAGCKRRALAPAPATKVTEQITAPAPAKILESAPFTDEADGSVKSPFPVYGPTIIAFFPITQAEVDKDADGSEALSDYQYYLFLMMQPLHDAHIHVYQSYDPTFQVQVDGQLITFHSKKVKYGYGYYFIEPGKAPHVVTEMMAQDDFRDEAKKYFGADVAEPKETE